MGLRELFAKEELLLAIDIGFSAVKLLEFDLRAEKPKLVNIGLTPLTEAVFSNNILSKPEQVAEVISELLESNAIKDKRVVTAIPSPVVFTKKIKMARAEPAELRESLHYEAGNFIPHSLDAVSLDYHVLGESGKSDLDVLVVAVKNEIIDSYLDAITQAGLETAVVDVDYFALQNMFELARPDLLGKTVALINIGARFSSINICKNGRSLFTGDMSVGGKMVTEALQEGVSVPFNDAELIKKGQKTHTDIEGVKAILDKQVEYMASEFNRQLSFFWNASGAEEGIDQILLTGGGSLLQGFPEELNEKTGIEVARLNPLAGIECGETFDKAYLDEIAPRMSVAVGLGIRNPGDREI